MDEKIGQRVFQQVMDIWIIPEIKIRKELGKITDNFILTKVQIVFSLYNGNIIRLNDEVKAIVKVKINKSVKKAEAVYEGDVDNMEKIELTDDDANCGHITLLLFRNNWLIAFDFRYDKQKSREFIEASKEFYQSAIDNFKKNRLRPLYENSFASAELSTTAILMLFINKKYLDNHNNKIKRLQDWANLGNVNPDFSNALTKLSKLRYSARYLSSDDFKNEDSKLILSIIKSMIDFAEKSLQ